MDVLFLPLLFKLKRRRYYDFGDGLQNTVFSICGRSGRRNDLMMNSADGFLGPVNIGNPNEFTMLELAQAVIELTDSNSKIIHLFTLKMILSKDSLILLLSKARLKGWSLR
jgi:UDP-glucuronate decarboxylase